MRINWFQPFTRLCKPEDDMGGGGGGNSDIVLQQHKGPVTDDGQQQQQHQQQKPGDSQQQQQKPGDSQQQQQKPGDSQQQQQQKPAEWTLESLLENIGLKDLKPGDPRLAQWNDVKGMVKKAVEVNQSQATKLVEMQQSIEAASKTEASLKEELATAKAGVKTGESTPAEVAAIQAELNKVKLEREKEQEELNEYRAKTNLAENPAFKQKYDGGRAELVNAAKEAATEIGLAPEKLDAVFAGTTEFQIRKAITELEIEDPVAEKLIIEKALGFAALTKERDALLSGKAGRKASELAAEWEAYHAQLGGALTARFTAELQGKILGGIDTVKTELSKVSPFFQTDAGQSVFEEIRGRFQQGFDLSIPEAIEGQAWLVAGPAYEKQAIEQAKTISDLKAQITALTGQIPSTEHGDGGKGSKPAGGGIQIPDPFASRGDEIVLGKPGRGVAVA